MAEAPTVCDSIADTIATWGLSSTQYDDVIKKLKDIGVDTTADLEFIEPEKDFAGMLSPIQCRKLKAKIQSAIYSGQHFSPLQRAPPSSSGSHISDSSDLDLLSMDASPSTSSSDTPLSPSQNWVASFYVPYSKFPPDLIEACEKGKRPKSHLRLEMIQILCAEIKMYTRLPGRKNLELIASKLCSKYPNSFQDVVGEEVLGSGVSSLVHQMSDRMVNAYGRGMKRSLDNNADVESASNSKRQTGATAYGCINFDPKIPDNKSKEELLAMKHFLSEEARKDQGVRDADKDRIYMDSTYPLQRALINKTNPIPTIEFIKDEWPLLFEYKYLMAHFKRLTGIGLDIKLRKSLSEKRDRLLNFINEKRSKTKGVKQILQMLTSVKGDDSRGVTDALLIKLVALCFGEDPDCILKEYEELTNASEVERHTKILPPHIAVIGDIMDPMAKTWLVIEKRVVTQTIANFTDALCMVYAAYYVLNLSYDVGLVGTMEFIQRCLVNLNPCKGSKTGKKGRGIPAKVLSFINSLNEMEWNM